MKLRRIISRAKMIDRSVEFLRKKTEQIYNSFEKIEDCETGPCEKEKRRLSDEMGSCINKLRLEERELDECEESFHACTGELI